MAVKIPALVYYTVAVLEIDLCFSDVTIRCILVHRFGYQCLGLTLTKIRRARIGLYKSIQGFVASVTPGDRVHKVQINRVQKALMAQQDRVSRKSRRSSPEIRSIPLKAVRFMLHAERDTLVRFSNCAMLYLTADES